MPRKYALLLALCLLSPFDLFSQKVEPPAAKTEKSDTETQTDKKKEELARIAIVPFDDRTNSKNFQYLSESLGDAINLSMYKEFSYERIGTIEVKNSIYKAEQEILKDKIEAIGKAPEKKDERAEVEALKKDEDQLKLIKRIAKDIPADIIVYGSYEYDTDANEIIFSVHLYLALSDSTRELEDTRNVVDNTIFQATEKVAKSLVLEISQMIQEAREAQTGTKEEKKAETRPGEKQTISRSIARMAVADWATKKVSMGIYFAFSLIPASKTTDWVPTKFSLSGGHVNLRYWPAPNFSLLVNYNNLHYNNIFTDGIGNNLASYDVEINNFMLYAGLGLYLQKQLHTYLDLGAGYYFGNIGSHYSNFNDIQTSISNPSFGARTGMDLLLTPSLFMGLGMSFIVYYDLDFNNIPRPIYSLDINLGLGLTF